MKKKLLSLFLIFTLILSLIFSFDITAFAVEGAYYQASQCNPNLCNNHRSIETNIDCKASVLASDSVDGGSFGAEGDNLTWTLDSEGTLTITGNGEMEDWHDGDAPWSDNIENINDVIIEEGVTGIGAYAFWCCNNLTSVTIPNGLTTVGYAAFVYCSSLTSVTIPADVINISEYVFCNCDSLSEIQVSAENPNYSSQGGILFNKDGTKLICYPAAKSGISYSIPSGVTDIDNSAFMNCINLTSVEIPVGVVSVGDAVFYGCSSMSEIQVSAENPNYSSNDGILFNKDGTEIICYPADKSGTSYSIPSTVIKLHDYSFAYNKYLNSVIIPKDVTVIGKFAFSDCEELTSIIIPDGVETMEDYVFYNCNKMTSVDIPESVTRIGDWSFAECHNLLSITIPSQVTDLGISAFYNCTGLTSINIPEGVTDINDWIFSGCTGLTSVSIPGSVNSINYCAFYGCSGLESVNISDGVTTIGDYAFTLCNKLSSVDIPGSVRRINYCAFLGCSGLESVNISDGVITIGDYAFTQCSKLSAVDIPDSVTSFGYGAFAECPSLISIMIPKGVEDIGDCVFTLSDSLSDIQVSADNQYFSSKDGILFNKDGTRLICYPADKEGSTYSIPSYTTVIGIAAFYSCKNLTSININNNVKSIEDGAFNKCAALISIIVPDSVTVINEWTFMDCASLISVTIPASVTDIAESAFDNCNSALIIRGYRNSAAENFAAQHDISFEKINSGSKGGGNSRTYVVNISDSEHGSIVASDNKTEKGNLVTLTVKPEEGYKLESLLVKDNNDKDISVTTKKIDEIYTFKMPSSNVTVEAIFKKEKNLSNLFVDVNENDYYYEAVLWAENKGITSGINATHFAPQNITTRAQMAALLWRAVGCPEPEAKICNFSDVKEDSYYYKAVLWANEQGITKGTSKTKFAPDAKVTRAQMVTFLARLNGIKDDGKGDLTNFADVKVTDYYNNAVAWAVENGITTGVGATKFAPNDDCLRCQIVTFLYRNFVG